MQLDYGDIPAPGTTTTQPDASNDGPTEEGEIEEGEIGEDEAPAAVPAAPVSAPLPTFVPSHPRTVISRGRVLPHDDMVIDESSSGPPLYMSAPLQSVVPALNLAHFGVDEKHARPGLASTSFAIDYQRHNI
jgi:hypothetical protein